MIHVAGDCLSLLVTFIQQLAEAPFIFKNMASRCFHFQYIGEKRGGRERSRVKDLRY